MREYKLYLTWTARLLSVGIPIGMSVALVAVTLGLVSTGVDVGVLAFLLVWIAVMVFTAMYLLRLPTRIGLSDDGRVRFKGRLRDFVVGVGEIESIKPGRNSIGFLEIKTRRGSIMILNQFDGFHEFLARLKELNPTVELRGC